VAQALVPAVPGIPFRGARSGFTPASGRNVRISKSSTHYSGMQTSRRRLPHIYPDNKWLFVTWTLHGSLPYGRYPPPEKMSAGQAFVWMDRYLDIARTGPLHLKDDRIAAVVHQSILRGADLGHYDLGAFVIMANHVHILIFPKIPPSKLLGVLKGSSAREVNRILGASGQPFWQAESYDHWVRNADEFNRVRNYIHTNPVKAGIVPHPEDYRWSSANAGVNTGTAGNSACATGAH
jgi:putative transposase